MSSFDAGSIESHLTVKRDQFTRDLDAAKAEAKKFSDGKYEATLKASNDDAKAKTDAAQAKVDKFGRASATATLKVNTKTAEADVDRLGKKVDTLGQKAAESLSKAPWWAGPAIASLPAAVTLLGTATGAATAFGATLVAGGGALAAYGLTAKSVIGQAATAAGAVTKAQTAYSAAIASGTGKAKAYAAEQVAITKAYAGLSPAQIGLSRQLAGLETAWKGVQKAETPAIAASVTPWLKGITAAAGDLKPVVTDVSHVIGDLGHQFDGLVGSGSFKGFLQFLGTEGSQTVGAGGSAILDFLQGFITLLPQFSPLIDDVDRGISNLGASFLNWAQSDRARADVQRFLGWVHDNGPAVTSFLKNAGAALVNVGHGLAAGSPAEINLLSRFFKLIADLPPSFVEPVSELAATLLTISKFGFGRKIISVGVDWTGKGAAALIKWLTGGTLDLTGKIGASAGMQKAADTMVTAAAGMQRAADTMVGAGEGGVGGGAAGKAAGEAEGEGGAVGGGAVASFVAGLGPAVLAIIGAAAAKGVLEATIGPKNTQTLGKIGSSGSPGGILELGKDPGFEKLIHATIPGWLEDVNKAYQKYILRNTPGVQAKPGSGGAKTIPPQEVYTHSGVGHLIGPGGTVTPVKSGPPPGPSSYENYKTGAPGPVIPKLDAAQYANLKQIATMYGVTLPQAYKLSQTATFNLGQSEKDQSKSAQAANARLSAAAGILQTMKGHSALAQSAMDKYTSSLRLNGAASSTTIGARHQLISDLENEGLTSKQATALVGKLSDGVSGYANNLTLTHPTRKQLIADLQASGLSASDARSAVNKYTNAVQQDGQNSDAARGARKRLITDLENAGLSAKQARTLVSNLGKSISNLHGKSVKIKVYASGTWNINQIATTGGGTGGPPLPNNAAGGLISGGVPGQDSVLGMLMPGELVVPTGLVNAGAVDHLRGMLPGFAGGGVVGSYSGNPGGEAGWVGSEYAATVKAIEQATAKAAAAGIQQAQKQAASLGGGYAGPGGGQPSANAALARKLVPKWASGSEWVAWNNVAMRESGWSNTAQNAASGAYGIAQALPYTKMPKAAWPASAGGSSNPTAQITWMASYMAGRYGDPIGAWKHELGSGWYADGGLVPGYATGGLVSGRPKTPVKSKTTSTGQLAKDTKDLKAAQAELDKLQKAAAAHVKKLRVPLERDELNLLDHPGLPESRKKALEASVSKQEKTIKDYREAQAKKEDDLTKKVALLKKLIAADAKPKAGPAPKIPAGSQKSYLAKLATDVTKLAKLKKTVSAHVKALRKPIDTEELYLLDHPGLSASKKSALKAKISKQEAAVKAYRKKETAAEDTVSKEITLLRALTGEPADAKYGGAGDTTTADDTAAADSGSGTDTTPPAGVFTGILPGPPAAYGGLDITGGGTGGLGGSGSSSPLVSLPSAPAFVSPGGEGFGSNYGTSASGAGLAGQVSGLPAVPGAGGTVGSGAEYYLAQLVALAKTAPAETGGHLGRALNGVSRSAYARSTYSAR